MTLAVETTGVIGSPEKRTYIAGAAAIKRGLAVVGGADDIHVVLAGASVVVRGFVEESIVNAGDPISIVMEGEFVAKIGAAVTPDAYLTTDANAQLVPAESGDPVCAMAVSSGSSAGDYIVARVVRFLWP